MRPTFRGKVYHVDRKKQDNVPDERIYDEESTNLIKLEKFNQILILSFGLIG